MKLRQIEAWALRIIDSVTAKKPIEDSQVELKREWPEIKKAARRIAGHANASQSEPILWLIGVDEDIGVTGCDPTHFPMWYQQVCSEFDDIAPSVTELALMLPGSLSCMVLQFDTDRAPYVIKNPVAGQPNSGPVSFEVPWRSATSIRSATRRELLKILLPYEMLPDIEVQQASLIVTTPVLVNNVAVNTWVFEASLYVVPPSRTRIVIPFHKCDLEVDVLRLPSQPLFQELSLDPLHQWVPNGSNGVKSENTSATIQSTYTEVIIDGPGLILVKARSADLNVNVTLPALPETTSFKLSLLPVYLVKPVVISGVLNQTNPERNTNEAARWIIQS